MILQIESKATKLILETHRLKSKLAIKKFSKMKKYYQQVILLFLLILLLGTCPLQAQKIESDSKNPTNPQPSSVISRLRKNWAIMYKNDNKFGEKCGAVSLQRPAQRRIVFKVW